MPKATNLVLVVLTVLCTSLYGMERSLSRVDAGLEEALEEALTGLRRFTPVDEYGAILSGIITDVKKKAQHAALFKACGGDSVEEVESLLEQGVELSASDGNGNNSFHHAAQNSNPQVLASLLARPPGSSCYKRENKRGEVPLHLAALKGAVECCRLLLDEDAPVDSLSKNGETPLMLAKDDAKIRLLVERGADLFRGNARGVTVLESIVLERSPEFCREIMVVSMVKHAHANNASSRDEVSWDLLRKKKKNGLGSEELYYVVSKGYPLTVDEMKRVYNYVLSSTIEKLKPLLEKAQARVESAARTAPEKKFDSPTKSAM